MAKANPRGTRMRRAVLDQLGTDLLEYVESGGNHVVGSDLEHSNIRPTLARMGCRTSWIAQHDAARVKRTIASGSGGPEDRHDRNAQGRGQVERAGIAADEERGPLSQGDQFTQRAGDGMSRSAAVPLHFPGELFFARSVVDQRLDARSFIKMAGDLAVSFGGPLFRSPTSAGIQDRKIRKAAMGQGNPRVLIGNFVGGEFSRRKRKVLACECRCQREVLLDDVRPAG